ncbi:hypothetical protein AVEN_180614-1 [Araneus ventricosus]|uniref:Uncharacterized protein n=1 Tax=Araneus ventricosus TaxID=182803 RepID=A0A4Y2W3K9_ARAVE|nr:hypothetical protein AVEN_180614-1 [Araneus ventricosus]
MTTDAPQILLLCLEALNHAEYCRDSQGCRCSDAVQAPSQNLPGGEVPQEGARHLANIIWSAERLKANQIYVQAWNNLQLVWTLRGTRKRPMRKKKPSVLGSDDPTSSQQLRWIAGPQEPASKHRKSHRSRKDSKQIQLRYVQAWTKQAWTCAFKGSRWIILSNTGLGIIPQKHCFDVDVLSPRSLRPNQS